ncbi:MAG: hypothetical protein JO187_10505 [Acidobacteria bacterium]|nr:hypothetical protein [Acidobacteriota bacterium]
MATGTTAIARTSTPTATEITTLTATTEIITATATATPAITGIPITTTD